MQMLQRSNTSSLNPIFPDLENNSYEPLCTRKKVQISHANYV